MGKYKKIEFIFLLLVLFQCNELFAQKYKRQDRIGFSMGPSFLYSENTGEMKFLKVKILPSGGIDYIKNFSTNWDIKANVGWQSIGTGSIDGEQFIKRITRGGDPFRFVGNLMTFDVTPLLYINPDRKGLQPDMWKVYVGSGLGYFYAIRKDEKRVVVDDVLMNETFRSIDQGIYLPIRTGMHTKLHKGDIGVEGVMLISPFQNIDGIANQYKKISTDVACQFQVFYRFNIYKF